MNGVTDIHGQVDGSNFLLTLEIIDRGLGWGYDSDDGIGASWPGGFARYVAVAPRDDSAGLRNLDFEL